MHSHSPVEILESACTLTVYTMFSIQFRRFQYIRCDSPKHHDLMKSFQKLMSQLMLLQFHAVAGALPQDWCDSSALFKFWVPRFKKYIILLRNGSRPHACTSPLGSERQMGTPSH